ncbi:MAG: hypothetical protein L3J31_04515 [Bacteroidales bacterium]|nr:hypothetical protein [Bacteroidales bacterium]MCF6342049.1 hypothetical protein [Bacteroidales bacterium]
MKYLALITLFFLSGLFLKAQNIVETEEGTVSYITSQNVYVKFKSTADISVGDTLYFLQDGHLAPALLVNNLSSISCVCTPLSSIQLKVNDKMVARKKPAVTKNAESEEPVGETAEVVPQVNTVPPPDSIVHPVNKQQINGRLSVSSYSNLSNTAGGNNQRMRYSLSLQANNIADSKFSVETYMSFVHSNVNWDEIKNNLFNGLKVYNLAVKYQPVESMNILVGRKINPNLSSIGAIDGLQIDKSFKSLLVGAFVGTRPDYTDYGFNINLLQYGAYFGHVFKNKNKREMRTILSFVQQTNKGKTDRRFAYFQHSNTLAKNLYFFGTAELELYQVVDSVPRSGLNLTNLYLMLRYRIIRQLSFSLSYSSRKNLIYYESYKSFVERLIEQESLQGFRFQVNYRPVRNLSIGLKAGYRSRKDDPSPSKNAYAYVSYSRVPWINASATLSATFLESSYLNGRIYSLRLSRDLVPGKLYSSLTYRYVDYRYTYYESSLKQQMGDINLSWRIIKNLSLSVSYEGIFETANIYHRLYINLTARL